MNTNQNLSKKPKQSSRGLKNHVESVDEGNKVKCDFCSSNFTVKGNLKRHIESIHEGKTFKCDICSSSFTERGGL